MRYLIRSVKYFIYISLLVTALLAVLAVSGFISPDINDMFTNGWQSVWMILLMFACVACFYPRFGYTKRRVAVNGDPAELRDGVVSVMEDRGYVLETEDAEKLTFRARSKMRRLTSLYEDRITIEKGIGLYVEGLTREVTRVVYAIEYRLQNDAS